MKVYRLERNGFGPFTQRLQVPVEGWGNYIKFKKGDNSHHFLYGVDDPEKLKEYFFAGGYESLLAEGFKVEEYEVPRRRVRYSEKEGYELAFHIGNTEEGEAMIWERFCNNSEGRKTLVFLGK